MKNNLQKLLIAKLIVLVCNISPAFSQAVKDLKFQRNQSSARIPNWGFNKEQYVPIEVKLKIEEKQPLSNDGIKFTVEWINHSEDSITLLNMVGGTNISFFTKDRYVPIRISSGIVNSIAPYKMKEVPFKIDELYINQTKQTSDITTSRTITILPNSIYSADLRIAEVVKYDRSWLDNAVDPNVPRYKVPKDEYKISFTARALTENPAKVKVAESLELKDVVVKYGM